MPGTQTFPSGPTQSQRILQYLQSNQGTAQYSSWQTTRATFWSFLNYPAAGQNVFNFFGFATGGAAPVNLQYTNMQNAGSLAQQFLLIKAIKTNYYLSTAKNLLSAPLNAGAAVDANNPAADFLYGFCQAGYLELDIGAKPFIQIPRPFLYAPPANGSSALTVGFGQTIAGGGQVDTLIANADLNRNKNGIFLTDPSIFLEAQQAFSVKIGYDSGAIPLISSNNYTTNFFIGVALDGILYRPLQ